MKESMDDKRYRMQMEERQGKMYGGKMKYSEGTLVRTDHAREMPHNEDQVEAAIQRLRDSAGAKANRKENSGGLPDDGALELNESMQEDKRTPKMSGGMLKYNEGSMLVAPEMGLEDEMPVDTYDNIPEDEMAKAEASQLPDDEMEEDYTSYVLEESLDVEEQEYLMGVLESDERLSGIFDKVMDIAGEFSGEGSVEGLGTGVSDSIPARLSDGEFVFTKKATDQMGADQLQTMMDEAEKAYDGGLMKKAFGGLTNDPMADEKGYMNEDGMTREAIKEQMIDANRMPSVRK